MITWGHAASHALVMGNVHHRCMMIVSVIVSDCKCPGIVSVIPHVKISIARKYCCSMGDTQRVTEAGVGTPGIVYCLALCATR